MKQAAVLVHIRYFNKKVKLKIARATSSLNQSEIPKNENYSISP